MHKKFYLRCVHVCACVHVCVCVCVCVCGLCVRASNKRTHARAHTHTHQLYGKERAAQIEASARSGVAAEFARNSQTVSMLRSGARNALLKKVEEARARVQKRHSIGQRGHDEISRVEAAQSALRLIDAGTQSFRDYERDEVRAKQHRRQLLEEAEAEKDEAFTLGKSSRKESGRTSAGLARSSSIRLAGATEKERLEFIQRPDAFFVTDTTRTKLKMLDDEMEALRFFSRTPSATAQALEALSGQRAAVLRKPQSEAPTPKARAGGVLGIAALDSAGSGLMNQELRLVVETAKSSASGPGRSLPRGLGGSRSKSALAGHRSVGVNSNKRSITPAAGGTVSPRSGGGSCGAVSKQLAPLLTQCRHSKRWEAGVCKGIVD
jgi:hypothetical protein